jgi:hypothetical protein
VRSRCVRLAHDEELDRVREERQDLVVVEPGQVRVGEILSRVLPRDADL